jgi:hypothetical protein
LSYSENDLERARQEERDAIAKFITDQGVPLPVWLQVYLEVKKNERSAAKLNRKISS